MLGLEAATAVVGRSAAPEVEAPEEALVMKTGALRRALAAAEEGARKEPRRAREEPIPAATIAKVVLVAKEKAARRIKTAAKVVEGGRRATLSTRPAFRS